ncbi:MAG: flagellar assembly peptidoglycan hydrolase FlgJ [Candidatus Thiodiazotropha sp. (ex Lucinoma borealis)]|nr:flagellar assembly peptidoglycan hydrolase FlgJ [Candidatus Thiodiazotropha sp. (ex Lucinoma borealis)]MCU7863074.1 flagellar assembly peptidoglycan hydrolase FlgJ [Candidatus Thiodiazotropha sp. (ex Lucinoma borealis)]
MNSVAPSLYHDFSGLTALKRQARDDQSGTAEQVARQFESLFVQMMVKQMRQASFGGGLFESKQTQFVQDMYDQQLSVNLSEKRGLGMLQMLRSQLGVEEKGTAQALSGLDNYWQNPASLARRQTPATTENPVPSTTNKVDLDKQSSLDKINSPESFVKSLWSAAEQAAIELGLPTEALLAQAALETGWGGHVMQSTDGQNSHNLFGIKADQRWDGGQVKKETLEYQQDVAVRKRENFRTYSSFEESFQDYVSFLKENPRYTDALQNTQDAAAYFKALQDAGYATDPNYAEKIIRVMHGQEMQTALSQFKSASHQPIQSEREAI